MLARLVVEHEEHVLLVLAPVSRDLPERLVVEERCAEFLVTVALQFAQEIVQLVDHRRAPLGPERRARRERMEHEEIELLADDPVVTLFRLVQAGQVLGQVFLLEERRAVDALQHLA